MYLVAHQDECLMVVGTPKAGTEQYVVNPLNGETIRCVVGTQQPRQCTCEPHAGAVGTPQRRRRISALPYTSYLSSMTQQHSIDDFIAAFGLVKKGKEYVGPCPVCKDGEDRFHVREGANGPVFGCRHCMDKGNDPSSENAKQVWALLRGGLSLQNGTGTPGNAPQRSPRARKEQPPPKPQPLPTGANVTRYDYTTADGEIVFVVIRRNKPNGKKADKNPFSQWTPAQDGQWLPVGSVGIKPMYQLPFVGTGGKVAIVEGEKCVHAVKSIWPKRIVTTWAGGTNAWQQTDWTPWLGSAGVVAGRRGCTRT